MEFAFGKINISIGKKQRQAPIMEVASGMQLAPWVFNRFDNPRENIAFIRETVSAAMHARSEAIGKGRFHGYELLVDKTGNPLKRILPHQHPLERLLRSPNPLFDLSDMLELSSQWLDATGNAILLKVRNGFGEVTELWPIPALSFFIEKGADQLPAYYTFFPTNAKIPASDIIHFKRSDIRTAPFYGHALLSDILDTAKTDSALRLYQQRFFDNDSVPRAVLKFPQGTILTQEQMNDIRSKWEEKYQGAANVSKLAILPDGGDLAAISAGAKEIDFAKSRAMLRDAIREAFRVPKIALGDTDNVNFSNAETSYNVFLRDVVDYALTKFSGALTKQLASEFSSTISIEHENLIPESEEKIQSRLQELKQSLSIDEQRAMLGLPPLPGGRGNVFVVGNVIYDGGWKRLGAAGSGVDG
ncbi:MAG: phage portal protein [Bacteroidota bacterium]|nr:phage portal protein [Bacteroidota bacterium]MDP4231498.1 phage portal protein [Bacteroidota bacterium]MDP4236933.1 phage portal protein [Bacteroidota bacterium]